ncbi:PD-(D/E)XK nuclease family protein [Desulfobulbus sp. F5]|nr:PD-(D/E)XK nuclease family protein [Desulfobulbus sp. F5]
MNIFKVLASGKKSFQEETASAVLAWFMNPAMEHGLGYAFLSRFINALSDSSENAELSNLAKKLTPRLRGEYESQVKLWFNLEHCVENAYIDIILGIDDWIIAIENKIYATSVTSGQLTREYEGLKKSGSEKVGMVYLVPVEEGAELIDGKTEQEFNSLAVKNVDFKILATWQKNRIGKVPSVSAILHEILVDESNGIIDPVSEYTRHTLKALLCFVSNDFSGYDYERSNQSSGRNPLTEEVLTANDLMQKDRGYVGVNYGTSGLLRMTVEDFKTYRFQYTTQNMQNKRKWMELYEFKNKVSWKLYGTTDGVVWEDKLSSDLLYQIARIFGEKVFIRMRGGESSLCKMDTEEIRNRSWSISMTKATAEYFDGKLFYDILSQKKIF